MWQTIRNIPRKFKQGIKNLIQYFPVIWNDRHWDDYYIYEILHRKLELKEKFFRSSNTHILEWERVADEIKLVKEALKRLIDHNYLEEETKEHDEKYGTQYLLDYINHDTVREEAVKMFRDACERADKREQKDREFVFDHMKKHIDGWWD